jgi:hypothetical protein
MAELSAPVPVAASAETAAAAPVASAPAPVAPAPAPVAPAPAPVAPAPAAPSAVSQETDIRDTLEALSGQMQPEQRTEFYKLVGGLMERSVEAQNRADEMEKQNKSFADNQKTMEEYNKDLAKHLIGVMVDLYENYNAGSNPVTDQLKAAAEKSLAENPMLLEFAKPITVCASAIKQQRAAEESQLAAKNAQMQKELKEAMEKVSWYTNQFGELPNMLGNKPVFEATQGPETTQAPAATPIAVCASAGQAEKKRKLIPDWLETACGAYQSNAFTSNRIYKDQVPSNYIDRK